MNLKTVNLHGPLGDKYGNVHQLQSDNIPLAISHINYNHKGFRNEIAAGEWQVELDGKKLTADDFKIPQSGEVLDIYPAIKGEKSSEQQTANILGTVLIVSAVLTAGATSPFLAAASPYLFKAAVLAYTYGYTLGLIPDEADTTRGSLNSSVSGVNNENSPIPLVFGRFRASGLRVALEVTQERRPE